MRRAFLLLRVLVYVVALALFAWVLHDLVPYPDPQPPPGEDEGDGQIGAAHDALLLVVVVVGGILTLAVALGERAAWRRRSR
ncbi:hypothetical protein [Nocardioides sp. SYSU D00038]|uniref:hypothetical protein n=1 Tax=Nocardioides sp. SYSU D00038 TaxID=2812554 RepID=UPI00196864C8|nr:hypothetical protein [Nocardioides sp. SYSU D00038]